MQLFLERFMGLSWVGNPAGGKGKGLPVTEVGNNILYVAKCKLFGIWQGAHVGTEIDRAG